MSCKAQWDLRKNKERSENSNQFEPREDPLLNRKEAAAYLGGLSPGTLAVWDCTGRYNLRPVKIGSAVRYRKSVLDQFLEDQTKP
jgi:hypothetical protein